MSPGFAEQLTTFQAQFDDQLKQALGDTPDAVARLAEASRYSLLAGGKRIRPYLVQCAARLVNADAESWWQPALAIEMVHCYSLVHDDLPAMDDDDLRRGQPTCHIAYDEATAILVGDALLTRAFDFLAEDQANGLSDKQRLGMIQQLAGASGLRGMVAGQAIDLAATGQELTLDQLEQMHRLKTGALIEASLLLGGLTQPKVNPDDLTRLLSFGQALGLLFQVVDDLLDLEGDTEVLGKPQGSDANHHKMTFPALMGVDGSRHYATDLHKKALSCLEPFGEKADSLRQLTDYILKRDH